MEAKLRQEIITAFNAYDRDVTLSNIKVGCVLGMVLMPAGSLLDYFVYRRSLADFLAWRLLCSLLIGLFLAFLFTPMGRRHVRVLGMVLLMLPTLCMSLMIYQKDGPTSPYYAGLNLVLLIMGFVLKWTFRESIVAVGLVLGMYLTACVLKVKGIPELHGTFFNNLYFLVCTGIVVTTGSYFLNALRFREFAGRYQLDQSKRQLEESNRKLLELDQIKSRFFANISHELRTPLTLMLAPLEKLQRSSASSDAQTRQIVETMHANGMRLLKLINDLLDLVRLDSGIMEVRREPVEIGAFVRGLASAARQMADDKHLTLLTTIDPTLGWVMVDRDKLEKVLLNLQFNALKFTPAHGQVEISARKERDDLVLEVKDTGMGISSRNLPNLFTRFWQADNSTRRKFQGVGIGLALVKELTELQGGGVSVQSEEGKGAMFTVRLPHISASEPLSVTDKPSDAQAPSPAIDGDSAPVADDEWIAGLYRRADLLSHSASASPIPPIVSAPRRGHQPKVLIADDEPDMRRFLHMELEAEYQVFEAYNGQHAVEEANRVLPDLILLDMMMPEKDGLEVCRELRQHTPTRSIPVILLTARADEETKLAALSAGASDFLPKPFSTTELQVRVKNLVESFQYQGRLARQNQVLENTIGQLKETEAQLVQHEKLASLGRMSAGIIHEINNPLNYAKTGLYALRQRAQTLPTEQRARLDDLLNEIEDGVNRVKTIVTDLSPFARHAHGAFDLHKVAPLVDTALRFLSHELKDEVRVEKSIPDDLVAWCSSAQLTQVLVNLLQNSRDALVQKNNGNGQALIRVTARGAGDSCLISIWDDGPGIPPEIMPKIFEPFFTTKDGLPGKGGMGLGLNICYRIMEAHGGKIAVQSEPGKYCEFTLELRASEPLPADTIDKTNLTS